MNHLTVRDLALVGTVPSRQILDMVQGHASDALAFDGDYDVQLAFMHRLRENLSLVGYAPPNEDEFEIRFLQLMSLLDGKQITQDSGTRIGEEDKDWQAEIDELLPKLAGRPT